MYDLVEIQRRLSNLIRIGTVASVNPLCGTVKVKLDDNLTTAPLSWLSLAGDVKSWSVPTIDEQAVIISPNGNLEQGMVIGSLFSLLFAQPANSDKIRTIKFADGSYCEYNETTKTMTVKATNVNIIGDLNVTGDINSTGTITADTDVVAKTISLVDHLHGGVMGGPSNTSKPV